MFKVWQVEIIDIYVLKPLFMSTSSTSNPNPKPTFSPGMQSPSDGAVEVALEELADLKSVWSELLKVFQKIEELKEIPWLTVQPRKV